MDYTNKGLVISSWKSSKDNMLALPFQPFVNGLVHFEFEPADMIFSFRCRIIQRRRNL